MFHFYKKYFSKYENELDDQFKNKDLAFFNLTYTRLMKRMNDSKIIYQTILKSPFDFSVDESFNTDYVKATYAKNVEELTERWRKQIKLSTLSSLVDRLKVQENKSKGVVDTTLPENVSIGKEIAPQEVKPVD